MSGLAFTYGATCAWVIQFALLGWDDSPEWVPVWILISAAVHTAVMLSFQDNDAEHRKRGE